MSSFVWRLVKVGENYMNCLASSTVSAERLSGLGMELEIVGKCVISSPFCFWKTETNSKPALRKEFCSRNWTNLFAVLYFWLVINGGRNQNAFLLCLQKLNIHNITIYTPRLQSKCPHHLKPILVSAGFEKVYLTCLLFRFYGCFINS